MRCPKCGYEDSRVIDSRSSDSGASIRRRRECLNPACNERFTTYERREEAPVQVRKKDGSLEPFDRSKLLNSLLKASVKRSIPVERLEDLINDVEAQLRYEFRSEVTSAEVGELVLARLLAVDTVAYVRFASVYRDFQDIDGFYAELNRIRSSGE
jgi:transcriptional repressor NrdR